MRISSLPGPDTKTLRETTYWVRISDLVYDDEEAKAYRNFGSRITPLPDEVERARKLVSRLLEDARGRQPEGGGVRSHSLYAFAKDELNYSRVLMGLPDKPRYKHSPMVVGLALCYLNFHLHDGNKRSEYKGEPFDWFKAERDRF